MTDMTVTVKLRWEKYVLYLGPIRVGRVSKLPVSDGPPWASFSEGLGWPVDCHSTEAEARAAVVAAVKKALGAGDE